MDERELGGEKGKILMTQEATKRFQKQTWLEAFLKIAKSRNVQDQGEE